MIFEAHMALLEDVELIEQVESYIKTEQCSASFALTEVGKSLVSMFEAMDNAYMRERAADIKDITEGMINHVLGHDVEAHVLSEPCIIVTHDLSPSQTSSLEKELVKGIITEVGGKTAHSAIIAKLLGIPYVVVEDSMAIFSEGQHVLLNGEDGQVIIEPDESAVEKYKELYEEQKSLANMYASLSGKPCRTKDGVGVELLANI
jgi:phosphotransferase system enzyme I (PtsI)